MAGIRFPAGETPDYVHENNRDAAPQPVDCPSCEGSGDCGFVDDARMTMGGPEHFTRDVHFVVVAGKKVCACCRGTTKVNDDETHAADDDCGSEPDEYEPEPEPEPPEAEPDFGKDYPEED